MSDPTAEPAADSAGADAQAEQATEDGESRSAFSEALAGAQAAADESAADDVDGDAVDNDELVAVTAERDEYLDALQRLKAEFSNHRKRVADQQTEQREQAAATLVEKLLPVLDACDAAIDQGIEGVKPINDQLLEALTNQGLVRVLPIDEPFDPEHHEAVLHEDGDDGPIVADVLRVGYAWNGRTIRPAMVKVRG